MDLWFALFVALVALTAAIGFSLALVGYINVIPAAFGAGRPWLLAVAVVPLAVVALPFAVLVIAQPFMAVPEPLVVARWLAAPAGVIHAIGLYRFFVSHWEGNAKTGKQLGAGLLLMVFAAGLLYGTGPFFAKRLVAAGVQAPIPDSNK